jgi:two-component system OmpR family response regulator
MRSAAKILIIDDEIKLLEVVESYLTKEGFAVLKAENGEEGLNYFIMRDRIA